ncbi:MAG: hypothetical protein KBT03_01280 [Bacteroidales bacterium]|nr:hypothetical protein [Candidatus Scybalousia scybalohippi]
MLFEHENSKYEQMATVYELIRFFEDELENNRVTKFVPPEHKLIIKFLKELETKRKEVKDTKDELEVYKKALELACGNLILEEITNDSHCGESVDELKNMYLQVARDDE